MSTFVLIEKYTVGAGGVSSVTLGSGGTLPQTFTDLKIVMSTRCTTADANFSSVYYEFNGSTTSKTIRYLYGSGGATGSGNDTSMAIVLTSGNANTTASVFGNAEIYLPNYTGSNYKSSSADGVSENNASTAYATLNANLWSNTAAITSIKLFYNAGNFAQYSTFYLYGILKA